MATVSLKVSCGDKLLNVYSLSLQQRIEWHHSFRIAVASESLEGKKAINIDNSVDFLGKIVEISITAKKNLSGDGLSFKGIVTSVHIDRTFTEDNLIIISGYSPTYLLEDGLGCQSFEEKKGDEIFKDIVGNYPANLLNPSGSGNYNEVIPYMVRYKETNFHFLSRLAATYGEWLYYTGQNLIYGKIQETNQVEISLGTDLQSYEYGVTMKPSNFDWLSYDYVKNGQLSKSSNSYKPASLDTYGKKALDVANSSFPGGHKIPTIYDIRENDQLKDRVDISKTSILSNSSTFNGQSTNPSLTIGTNLKIHANNKIKGVFNKVFINRFRVTGVHHHVNQNRDYSNNFEALPFDCIIPPMNPNVFKPEAESQVAVVIDNEDPEKLGRIRVKFNWQNGEKEKKPWIRIATNHAGLDDENGSYGMYFVPEVGDEVYIDFEQGNPNRPYMTGAKYQGKDKKAPEWGAKPKENNLKAIKTRSGHSIILNDEKGKESITISDKNGDSITIDTAKKTISINAENNISISAKNSITLSAKSIILDADKKDGEVKIIGRSKVSASSQDTSVTGSDVVKLSGGTATEINAGNLVNISSNNEVMITGNAKSTISSSGITAVEGTLVKLN